MSAGTATVVRGAECRKFAPNIFNKSKCSSCFKQKEEHSAEALECNRATRKISKCGYLFVAPGWDFSNPLNRTKRWQRRWFVLYDDGELTYSVDEHPETVPQARIDMTRVLEVAAAEDITGHPYSLAITSPEGVTFVKGTCREETRWWADVLQVYSRNKGRHKRNATFPGSQATILQVTPTIRSNTPNPARPRFNSCRSEPRCGAMWIPESSNASELCPSVFPPPPALSSLNNNSNNSNNIVPLASRSMTLHSNTEVADVAANESRSGTSSLENGTNSGNNFLTSSSNNICSTVTTTSSSASLNGNIGANQVSGALSHQQSTSNASNNAASSGLGVLSEKPPMVPSESRSPAYRDQPPSGSSPPTRDKLRAEDKARRRVGQMTERNSSIAGVAATTNEKLEDDTCRRIFLEHEREKEGKLRDIAASLTQPRVRRIKPRSLEPTRDVVDASSATQRDKLIRGDPDGCGLDISSIRYSPTSELRVDLPAENVLNIKKGWLMKQGLNKEWNKHWFVLRGCGLMYYRDPCAEDKGIMDGVIDLNTVTAVTPLQVARNYGFQTMAWDERGTTVLSAVTAGIRSSWMAAIRKAANLPDPDSNGEALSVCPDAQQENNPQSPTTSITDRERDSVAPPTSVTPRSVLFSSDEEYRTASEGGRRESGDWSELPVSPPLIRNGEWSLKGSNWSDTTTHEWSELPPSPPLTRTALSRVKARSRSSSRSRVYKRSRSSPPSSRRSTLDSVRSEDLMMACCGELGEDEEPMVELLENRVSLLRDQLDQNQPSAHPSALLVVVERQENEIETLKSQLSAARADASATEKELARLRQQKAEATIREKQVDELLSSIQRTEQQRSKDLDDLEKMKKLCAREKEMLECKLLETEAILRETTERCEMLSNELATSHRSVEHLQAEVQTLSDRLSQGIEENERLYNRIRELEERGGLSAARERGRSFDSLSDLTNVDLDMDLSTLDKERIVEEYDELRSRFEKAISEIRAMRKELREAHSTQDALELEIFAYKQDAVGVNETNQAQVQLMAARIQDLTNKLAASEKQVRTLKQKLTKAESREKRRSLSLKGKESFHISQEMEDKLVDLENKICAIERGNKCSGSDNSKESSPSSKKERKKSDQRSLDRANLRRKSLDSATSSEPMKVLIRLSSLETKVANVVESVANSDVEKDSSECSEAGGASPCADMSAKLLFRLKKLERVVWKSKRKLEQCLNSAQPDKEKAERCLHEVNDLLHSCGEQKKEQIDSQESQQCAAVLVSRLEAILKDKLSELMKRRQVLAQNERLDEREKVRLIAERVAFESVILGQLKRAIRGVSLDRSAVLSDLLETSQLASSLKRKLHGTKPKTYQKTSYVQYLSRVLADRLVLVGGVLPKEEGPSEKEECEEEMEVQALRNESLSLLLQRQKELEELVRCYKDKRLKQLAESLAAETFNMSSSSSSSSSEEEKFSKKLSDDRRVREAWSLAHETLNKELVQAEIARVMTHCAQLYEQDTQPSILDACLSLSQTSGVSMETWGDEARCKLREEIDLAIQELCCSYKDFLRAMKRNKSCKVNELKPSLESPHQLLTDYADVIAHKALMDARIAVLKKNASKLYSPSSSASNFHGETFVSSLIEKEDLLALLTGESESELQAFGSPLLDAEFQYLYEKSREDCENRISGKWESKEQVKSMSQNLAYLEEDLTGLCKSIKEKTAEKLDDPICRLDHSASRTATDWSSVCDKCSQLREHVKRLNDYVTSATCKRCSQLQESMERLRARHQEELETLKRNQEKDLMEIRGELDSQRQSLTNQYEQEAATLRERARKLEYRLNAMDSEHSAHVNELRAAYQRSMSAELDTDAETRKRYKEEIKHLRALCEKGLIAMENSHRRIISELEEKHKQELENLRVEKEQALSEETQATLAALDAMRKAHEHEVQKEIAKFKQEFVKQMQAREDIGILHKEHEEEMEEIKQEILSLSAKYSSKCVESAALEEKVGSLTKQLAQAQQHIMQLDARNKQLRAHLVLDCSDAGINDAIQILRGPESGSNEAIQQRDEIHRLQQHVKHGELARSSHRVDSRTRAREEHEDDLQERSRDNEEEDNEREEATRASDDCQKSGVQSGELERQQQHSQTAGAAPSAAFSYRLERVRSISLPYTNNLVKSTGNSGVAGGSATSNASSTTLWDSLRSRSGLPQQYQGGTAAEMRVSTSGDRKQEVKQTESKQQQLQSETRVNRTTIAHASPYLSAEPSALSVAELMRSPAVKWSSRSCRSLPPTPTPSYHQALHPPLPVVGMVAERKKRFEL